VISSSDEFNDEKHRRFPGLAYRMLLLFKENLR